MNISIHFHRRTGAQAAFTQLELLVSIVVVAMLAMLSLSATARLTNQTRIAQCSNNLRQLALSQLLYASDNSDKLPALATAGGWAWDLEWNTGNAIAQYGAPQKVVYCPGTAPRFNAAINAALYSYAPRSIHVIGYALTLPNNGSVAATNVNVALTQAPSAATPALLLPQSPSQRVLTADANLSSGGSYTSIPGGFTYQGHLLPHLCPHLDGLVPAGGNLAMLDGHVEWRPFKLMQVRTNPTVNGQSIPSFYW
jgi:prepilin-type processing-associated H-X9-DG protein